MKSPVSATALLALVILFVGPVSWPRTAEPTRVAARVPVLLDTDIGDEIDDAFALALVLNSPELDLRGVTTVHRDAYTRALIVCRLLHAVGRDDIPVASGAPPRDRPETGGQFQYGLRPCVRKRPERATAAEFLYQQLKAHPGELTLLALGPLTNIAELLRQHPDCKPWIKRIVLMGGTLQQPYADKSLLVPEWNLRTDVTAAQAVFASGVPLVVAPLDATVNLKLESPQCQRIFRAGTPLAQELHALYQLWDKATPTLFDPLAAALCFEEKFCKLKDLRLVVDAQGFTRMAEGKPNGRVAVETDRVEFLAWFVERLARRAAPAASAPQTVTVGSKAAKLNRLIPLNNASLAELQKLPGIGPKFAQRIIDERRKGAFKSVDDLRRIKGLGSKKIQGLLPFVTVEHEPRNVVAPVAQGAMPHRVYVIEDYETDIERRWCLCGKLETKNVPPGSRRACRGVLTNDFDDRMGDPDARYSAVIFNPVPGPLMGKNTRLSFRYWLKGTDTLRVQIYSLTRGYHRHLVLTDLPQGRWQTATVDLTAARRPDGSGGPLAEKERIGDLQFYADPNAELIIGDIVLYDAALPGETRPFPKRPLFTAWFDMGKQGEKWPGDFEIVSKGPPHTAKAARAVPHPRTGDPWIRLDLRGERRLGATMHLRFRYWLSGANTLRVRLVNRTRKDSYLMELKDCARDAWAESTLDFSAGAKRGDGGKARLRLEDRVDEIQFLVPRGADLLVDAVLLYEPGVTGK